MVPVLANGFSDLKQRRDWQQAVEDAQINKTDEIQERISSLLSKQDIDVSAQVQVIQKQQLRLTRRLLSLMVKINDLASDRTSLTIHEQETYNRMQNIVKTLNAHPLRDSEITALERRCDSLAESSLLDPFSSLKKEGSNSAASIPGLSLEGPDSLLELVSRQQKGISILIETLDRDSRDLDLIRHGIMQ